MGSHPSSRTSVAEAIPVTAGQRSAADSHDVIEVRGARENNLADISLDIPKRRLTVFTGVSGSGITRR
jgi:excinuclease UvrABC ATPase subunit